ncbi:copper-binding protein [Phenylobacterium sp.]|jgi:Cu/Ag efflux protein CusF|uniref:copper-binding protein n=1 Tax=Phenylobacterium sp. TaxID=1871053 RepID=UPI002F92AB90
MSTRRVLLAAAVVAGLSGCTGSEPDPAPAEAAVPTTATGVGTVVGIDPPNGTVTLQHGPMPEIGWPAMRMAFKASPQIIAAVKNGDRVEFDLKLEGLSSEITAVRRTLEAR